MNWQAAFVGNVHEPEGLVLNAGRTLNCKSLAKSWPTLAGHRGAIGVLPEKREKPGDLAPGVPGGSPDEKSEDKLQS